MISEEEAIASKASGIHECKSVCLFVCPMHQKTKPIDKYVDISTSTTMYIVVTLCLQSKETNQIEIIHLWNSLA